MRRAIFPGSFDPITKGHVDIIRRSLPLFDELIIAIGVNSTKKYMFSLEKRKGFIETTFTKEKKIKVDTYEGLKSIIAIKLKLILLFVVYVIPQTLNLKKLLHR